jgi:hypothetical protein
MPGKKREFNERMVQILDFRTGLDGRYPSVDAPLQARENFGVVVARGRMLSSSGL